MNKIKAVITTTIFAIAIFAATNSVLAQQDALKFDQTLQNDFAAGMGGDAAARTRAFERADKILANNPNDADTLVWHGAATLAQSGGEFQTGNFREGAALWQKGLQEMDKAVELAPDSFSVRMVRGSTFLNAAKHFPDPATAKELREKGAADYEKILSLTDEKTVSIVATKKNKIFNSLIETYETLGDKAKADQYRGQLAKLGK